ncbi:MAG: hypothetical protein Q7T01_03145 [bacterium]|nr:hypothetical protein [bacterium]
MIVVTMTQGLRIGRRPCEVLARKEPVTLRDALALLIGSEEFRQFGATIEARTTTCLTVSIKTDMCMLGFIFEGPAEMMDHLWRVVRQLSNAERFRSNAVHAVTEFHDALEGDRCWDTLVLAFAMHWLMDARCAVMDWTLFRAFNALSIGDRIAVYTMCCEQPAEHPATLIALAA